MTTFLLVASLAAAPTAGAQSYSELWGRSGERWTPTGRIPDVSYAGYRQGERPIPAVPAAANVRDFGAVGDGEHDDTEAFQQALAAVEQGAIEVPPGRYRITDILEITQPSVVLRGAGPAETVLVFPTPLQEIRPNMGATTSGRPTSNYSWSGGLVWFRGTYGLQPLTPIAQPAQRGDRSLVVEDSSAVAIGDWVEVYVEDEPGLSLVRHLYGGDPGDTDMLAERHNAVQQVARVEAVDGARVLLDRPLRFDLRPEWTPRLRRFAPTVTECGLEGIGFEFPNTPYGGHFSEQGYNAVTFTDTAHCWARDLRIHNADSGIFVRGRFITLDGITFTSDRAPWRHQRGRGHHPDSTTGHHGVSLVDDDNLLTRFDFRTRFVHDITLAHAAGNVVSEGRGDDLAIDHHKRYPYANVLTDLDFGAGTRPWQSGGGQALGKHAGGWTTFWNLRADRPLPTMPGRYGPGLMNVVGVELEGPPRLRALWYEPVSGGRLRPANLHQAQLLHRLMGRWGAVH